MLCRVTYINNICVCVCVWLADKNVSVVVARATSTADENDDDDRGRECDFSATIKGVPLAPYKRIYIYFALFGTFMVCGMRGCETFARDALFNVTISRAGDVAGIMNLTLCAVTIARVIIITS